MHGLKVGHISYQERGTGLSVFLFDVSVSACGGYIICGSGPASHELAPLDPETSVASIHGLMLSGGSAFGLYAAKGVMDYLAERHIGLKLPHGVVPIVPAAAIYDLAYKEASILTDKDAYQACLLATDDNAQSGRIGAGTGATVGKIVPDTHGMTAGLGRAELVTLDGLQVIAYAVVNAIGDIRDNKNNIVAGARYPSGDFADCENYLISGKAEEIIFQHQNNTTLVAVFTNAKFTKAESKRVAKMAIAGMARAIKPVFTCYDGDILFCISLGEVEASVLTVGTIAQHLVRVAILDAVKDSEVVL